MSLRRSSLLVAAAVTLSTSLIGPIRPAPARAAEPGPPLQEPEAALARAVSCPDTFRAERGPVLLVHGTAGSPDDFAANYGRILPTMGFDVCTVELVDIGRGDIQASAERVVYAVRMMARRSQRKVSVVGHSMGPLVVRWAIKWWPDLRLLVDDMVGIAAPQHGWLGTEVFCAAGCPPALWQMRRGSNFMAAFNTGDETPGDVSYTAVYTATDELVQPFSTADLDGGVNVKIQDLCPGRVGEHFEMLFDAAASGVVLDALTHPGPADPSRVDRSLCRLLTMPGSTPADLAAAEVTAWTVGGPALQQHKVDHEPPLAAYARP